PGKLVPLIRNPQSAIRNPQSAMPLIGYHAPQEIAMKARLLLVAALFALVPAAAFPQALTSLASVRVQYVTRKNTVKPLGELKAQIDALDAQIAEASRAGRNGELRRLFAKGMSLLNNQPWTDAVEYGRSIVLRSDRVV